MLIAAHGDLAYAEARSQARAARQAGDRRTYRAQSRAAVEIARIKGHEGGIGVTGADRYLG